MIIEKLNGDRLHIGDHGLFRLFHHIPSAEVDHTTASVNGGGEVITETTIKQRTITVELAFKVKDIYDYYLLRDELNGLFVRSESFYIIFEREPYKKWLVKLGDQYTIPVHPKGGKFDIEFRTVKKFAESVATTLSSKEWDADIWWWNGAITWDDPISYSFNANSFNVINLGSYKVDPEERGTNIKITVRASASSLTIRNLTNGSSYVYNGVLSPSDVLVLDGVRSFKNGVSVFKDTNKECLKLSPGVNQIQITGGTISSIDFDFRFPFL